MIFSLKIWKCFVKEFSAIEMSLLLAENTILCMKISAESNLTPEIPKPYLFPEFVWILAKSDIKAVANSTI